MGSPGDSTVLEGAQADAASPDGSQASAPVELPTLEELEAAMLTIPSELEVVSDETLREEGDPEGYPLPSTVGGVPVTILRDRHPATGILLRIKTVRTDSVDGLPILHGPEWTYFDTAALSSMQWWKENVLHGPAQHWRRVGTRKSEGRFFEGERDGLRREYAKNGKLLSEGAYRRGVAIGQHQEWFPSGQKMRIESYVDGRLEGQRRIWDRDGLLVLDENYVAGERHGRWSDFHPGDGDPREWGEFDAGVRVGIWQRGSQDGVVLETVAFVDDRKDGLGRIWNHAGQLIEEVTYVRGVKTGKRRTWYDDGTPQSEGTLEDGLRTGVWTYWKADGELNDLWSGTYEGDQRVDSSTDDG